MRNSSYKVDSTFVYTNFSLNENLLGIKNIVFQAVILGIWLVTKAIITSLLKIVIHLNIKHMYL